MNPNYPGLYFISINPDLVDCCLTYPSRRPSSTKSHYRAANKSPASTQKRQEEISWSRAFSLDMRLLARLDEIGSFSVEDQDGDELLRIWGALNNKDWATMRIFSIIVYNIKDQNSTSWLSSWPNQPRLLNIHPELYFFRVDQAHHLQE